MHGLDVEASHSALRPGRPALVALPPALLLALGLAGCPSEPPADDDDSSVAGDDDDSTAPPDPLADTLGVVNLTNVRQPGGTDYVDLSGAFGDFAGLDTSLVAPTSYLASWGATVPLWREDLGLWALPATETGAVEDLLAFEPWYPDEQIWWDAGSRLGLGPYLSQRTTWDVDDLSTVLAYAVDDPLSPGGDAWTPGATLRFETAGGADIVAWASEPVVALPDDMELVEPLPGSTLAHPAARDLTVQWNAQDDDAVVSVVLYQGVGPAWVARVADTGSHTIPSAVLHDELGLGTWELIVARQIETAAPHPQGDVLVRTRAEERADVVLLDDLLLEPAYATAGSAVTVTASWFTGTFDGTTVVDLGAGVTVQSVTPDGSDPSVATLQLSIDPAADLGARDATLTTGGDTISRTAAFTVLDLDPADDCAAADLLGDLDLGSYTSSTVGLSNSLGAGYACLDWTLNGADAVYPVYFEAGRTVRITANMPEPADVAVIVLDSCGDPATAVACADDGLEGEDEVLLFEPPADGRYYVVVDAYASAGYGSPSSPFTLTLEGGAEASPIDPPWIVRGATASEHAVPGTWDAGLTAGDVDAGADVTISAASAPGDLLFTAEAGAGAALGPRDVVVSSGGGVTLTDALLVSDLPATDSCAAADAWGPTALTGTAWVGGVTDTLPQVNCFAWEGLGPEVVHALDLTAGDTVSVTATSGEDLMIYLLTDCALPEDTCVEDASADDVIGGGTETFSGWVTPSTGRWYLVVDTFEQPLSPTWTYELLVDVQ